MPKKPTGTRRKRGLVVPDLKSVPADIGNDARTTFAYECRYLKRLGYSETRTEIMTSFKVSHATAERDIASAKLLFARLNAKRLPEIQADLVEELLEICAAARKSKEFTPAIQAIKLLGEWGGFAAPTKSVVTVGPPRATIDFTALSQEEAVDLLEKLERAAPELVTERKDET